MKKMIFVFVLMVFRVCAQDYVAPKPQLLFSNYYASLKGNVSVAWFYPEKAKSQVELFEKMEVGFDLPEIYRKQISAFFDVHSKEKQKVNPYNRHDIDITVQFFLNDVLVSSVDAFYYEEYWKDTKQNKWVKDTTSYSFRVRFSPDKPGIYTAKVSIESKYLPELYSSFEFEAIQGERKGYLEMGADGKHFRYADSKKSFMGVGQVIPWAEWSDGKLDKVNRPAEFNLFYSALEALKDANGNFTRFVAAPWFMEMEWEALGNYSPKLGQAWEFDRVDDYCRAQELYYIFCLRLHTQLESHNDFHDGLRWEANCYNDNDVTPAEIAHEPKIGITKVSEFYSNEKAKDHNKNYLRYMISRWGYSASLAAWQVMSEMDNTFEYRDKIENGVVVEDHSQNRLHCRNWTHEMIRYIDGELKDKHLLSVAIADGIGYSKNYYDPELYAIPEIDFYGLHDYIYEVDLPGGKIRNRNLFLRFNGLNDIGTGYQNGELSFPSFQKKMFIFDEFGQIAAIPKEWPLKDNTDPTVDYNNCTGFMIKQDLWFTATAGSSLAGLDWWNYAQLKRKEDWKLYYPGLLKFFNGIDFEKVNYTKVRFLEKKPLIAQRWPYSEKEITASNSKPYTKGDLLEVYTQVAEGGEQAFGWMNNRSVQWANLLEEYPCLKALAEGLSPYSKKYLSKPSDDDVVDKPIDLKDNFYYFKVNFLQKKKDYTVEFYNTITGEIYAVKEFKANGKGVLKVYAPEMDHKNNPDLAFKIYLKGTSFK